MRGLTPGERRSGLAGLILIAALLLLPALLPTPQFEARLFSEGWGASLFIDPELCSTPGQLILLPKTATQASGLDRLALAARYLAWGLLLPALALAAVLHRAGLRRRPGMALVLLYGLAPGEFAATLAPAFARLRLNIAEMWMAHGRFDETDFFLLDTLSLAFWLGGFALLAGGGSLLCVRGAARLTGLAWRHLATALLPMGGILLLLGLTENTALYLRAEGIALARLPFWRAGLIAAGLWISWRRIGQSLAGCARIAPWPRRCARACLARLLLHLPLAFALLYAFAMYFHWSQHDHV